MSDCCSRLHESEYEFFLSLRSAVRPHETPWRRLLSCIMWSPEKARVLQLGSPPRADLWLSVQPQQLLLLLSACLPAEPHPALLLPRFLLRA